MDPDEIIKSLRWLAKETEFVFGAEQLNEAADLIESLQKEISQLAIESTKRELTLAKLEAEVMRCTVVDVTNAELQSQLSELERQRLMAVEDIYKTRMCHVCEFFRKETGLGGIQCSNPCATTKNENFRWRGAQKGDAE